MVPGCCGAAATSSDCGLRLHDERRILDHWATSKHLQSRRMWALDAVTQHTSAWQPFCKCKTAATSLDQCNLHCIQGIHFAKRLAQQQHF